MKSIFLTFAVVLLAATAFGEDKTEPQKPLIRKAAPLTGLTFVKGDPVKLKAGKVYVVEFWATWCGPCRITMPHLNEVQKRYKDKGLTVIGISNEEKLDTVKKFVAEQGDKMNYTVAWDPQFKVHAGYMQAYGQQGIPMAFIVDQKGYVVWVSHPMSDMDAVLEKVVAGEFDATAYAKEKADREALEKRLYQLFRTYFTDLQKGKSVEQARPTAETIIEIGHAEALNMLAWQMLVNPDPTKRDPATALKAAEKVNTQTKGENPIALDTYAMALFENGKAKEAVAAQEKAVMLAATIDNEQLQTELKNHLTKYKKALEESTK